MSKAFKPATPANVQAKFAATRRELAAALIERDDEIDLVLTALVASEHVLFVGPPGCGKSLLLDSLLAWTGGNKFSILLNKFSVPEELFGPVSISGLKEDRYVRVTDGRLPEADFAFVDEIFKASSAILNTLLKLLNERTFDAGDGKARKVPLKLCVAASNEWPSTENGKELGALFDRFVLRKTVKPIASAAGRKRLLWDADLTPKLTTSVTPAEVAKAQAEAAALPWSDGAKDAMEKLLKELATEGIVPGDRRTRKAVGVTRAFAWLNGSPAVEPEHLEVLAACLWDDPTEQPEKAAKIVAKVANPAAALVGALLVEAEGVIAATNPKVLAQAASAAAKLAEIERKLASVPGGNGRAAKAREYVAAELKRIKVASIESL